MDVVGTWTGRHASALRHALRLTNEGFAEPWVRLCELSRSGMQIRPSFLCQRSSEPLIRCSTKHRPT